MSRFLDATDESTDGKALRDILIDKLVEQGIVRTPEVETAMRAIPREAFLPGVPLEKVYADDIVRLRFDGQGKCISSASAPWLVAAMLEQARLRPGHRVLEIGTATGINARYLGELVGDTGQVTTVEIMPDLIDGAQQGLEATGARNVTVVPGDGEYGAADAAPFDSIIVTAQAPDLATAWLDQLKRTGSWLIVPLTLRGLSRCFTFEPEGDHWIATTMQQCGFVAMQGDGAKSLRTIELGPGGVELRVDDDQPADAAALIAALAGPAHRVRTGVPLAAGEPALAFLDMWLAQRLEVFGSFLNGGPDVDCDGPLGRTVPFGNAATWDESSISYVALRRSKDEERCYELGVWGHGPNRERLADLLACEVRAWDRDLRGGPEPTVRAYRAGTPEHQLVDGRVIRRRNTLMVMSRT